MRSFQKKEAREILRFIQEVPLFQGFYSRQKDNLAKRFVEREYKVGEKIVTQGLGGEGFFILIKGHADAFRTRADGTQMQVNSFGPTVFFRELALLDDKLRTASVIATELYLCLVLTRWDFLVLMKEDCEMAVIVLGEIARRLRAALDT
jgi:CRP/FNR family cyclic AMP-dependent transcriptional regulator